MAQNAPMRVRLLLSLRTKTFLAIAAGLLASSAILTYLQYRADCRTLAAEWEAKGTQFAKILDLAIQPLLESRDQRALARTTAQASLVPEIRSVTVVDAQGVIVADSTDHNLGKRLALHLDALRLALDQAKEDVSWVETRETGRVRYVLSPVRARSGSGPSSQHAQVSGAILIGMDLAVMDRLLHADLRSLVVVNGITFTALLIVCWVAIRLGLVRPLTSLAKSVRSALAVPLSFKDQDDEIGTLTEAFAGINEALQESEQFGRSILHSIPAHTAILDKEGDLLSVNPAWERFAKEHGELFPSTGGRVVNYLKVCGSPSRGYGEQAPEAIAGIQAVLNGAQPRFTLEYLCPLPKEPRWFLLTAIPLRGKGGAVISHVESTEKYREQERVRKVQAEAEHTNRRLDALYESVPIGLMYLSSNLIIERVSRLVAEIHGHPAEDHIDQWLPGLLPSERWNKLRPIVEQVLQSGKPYHGFDEELADPRIPGGIRYLLSDFYPDCSNDETVRGIYIAVQDMTAHRHAQKEHERHLSELTAKNRELDQMAIRDPLTGLYNRRFFDEALTREWQQFQRSGEPFTVIIMDVDAFKAINDHHGHETGDRALQQAGHALRSSLRESDLIARVGGDEFAALLPRTDTDHAQQVFEKLRQILSALPVQSSTGDICVSLSFGSATVPGFPPVTCAAELLRVADKRMYEAKRVASSRRADTG